MDIKTLCIAIAAVIMAIEAGLRNAPTLRGKLPTFVSSEIWNFIPLVLLTIAGAIWVYLEFSPPSLVLTAMPSSDAVPIIQSQALTIATVKGAFIKPEDQIYAGQQLAKRTTGERLDCTAQIIHCPSTDCEDDAQAVLAILALGKWNQRGLPTSHDWEKLSAGAKSSDYQQLTPRRIVLHQAVMDDCATALTLSLYEVGADSNEWKDHTMRGKGVEVLVGLTPRK